VKFGAPWCAHCKEFDSVYLSIAQRLSDNANANIMLAEMDAHLNEVEGVDIKEYPTVLLYTRKNKANPVLYEGERTEEKILLFLQENIDYIVKTTKPKKDL
jgi:thiol-disulfide isomerase/thioredoxin